MTPPATSSALGVTGYADTARTRQLLQDSPFDAVVAAWPENVGYLSGFYHPDMRLTWERLHLVVWPSAGEPVYVVPRVRADGWNGAPGPSFAPEESRPFIEDVRGYDGEHLGMVDATADALRDRGVTSGLLGIEARSLPAKVALGLGERLPGLRQADAWPLFNAMRAVKTPAEVDVLTRVNTLTARALEEVLAGARPGQTERELATDLTGRLWRDGAQELSHSVLGGGTRAGQWHAWPSDHVLTDGMLIRSDWGVRIDGYTSDIARTAVVGTATRHQRDLFARIAEVHDLLVDRVRPGVGASELVGFARRQYARLGLEYRWTIAGHGIGLVLHEEPQLSVDYDDPILEGMVLEVELGWVSPQEGYHLEDLVHVGPERTTNLTRPPGGHRLIETGPGAPAPG